MIASPLVGKLIIHKLDVLVYMNTRRNPRLYIILNEDKIKEGERKEGG